MDGEAVDAGLNPLTDHSGVLDVVHSDPSRFDLYTEDSIYDLRMGGLMLNAAGADNIEIEFEIEESFNLHDWEQLEVITRQFLIPPNRQFLRMRAGQTE